MASSAPIVYREALLVCTSSRHTLQNFCRGFSQLVVSLVVNESCSYCLAAPDSFSGPKLLVARSMVGARGARGSHSH